MFSIRIAILLVALLCSPVLGQFKSEVSVKYVIDGIVSPMQFGDILIVSAESNPVVVPVGFLKIESSGKLDVLAEDAERRPVKVRELGDNSFLIMGRGRLWIDVMSAQIVDGVLDFDRERFTIDVGVVPEPDKPDDPDKPDPDTPAPEVPDDDFDNLGQRVAKLAVGLPSNAALSEIYADAAKQLRGDPSVTINQVSEAMLKKFEDVTEYRQYAKVRELINTETTQRWPMSKGVLADFWSAVSAGYGGAK